MDTQQGFSELALFAGAGLGLLGTHMLGAKLVCAVEWDKYAASVLAARMRDEWITRAPIWDNVFSFDGRPWRGRVDVLSAGFPCQPFSVAGKRRAADDARNGWPHTARIIREVRSPVVWLENVPGLVSGSHGYFGRVLGDLATLGYDAEWCVLGARDAGAPHRRDRLFILAIDAHADRRRLAQFAQLYGQPGQGQHGQHGHDAMRLRRHVSDTDRDELRTQQEHERGEQGTTVTPKHGRAGSMANTDRPRRQKLDAATEPDHSRQHTGRAFAEWGTWHVEPDVGRVVDGIAHRVDRLRALGNGQVPQQVMLAWRELWGRALENGGIAR